ncbi:MAG: outer membrane protein assembly factor BamD [Steroidobacteraceae bacterium]
MNCTTIRSALCLVLLVVAGCGSNPERELQQTDPIRLYDRARRSLSSQDYDNAIKLYEALAARYPFTDQARQARLDLIYAYYRARESESAIDAAETFIRENPTHPRVDYAWYIKGLVDFERTPNKVERLFGIDLTERPPTTARKAFDSLSTVVERYPKSEYAHDARQRMIHLRNRLADYEVHVAKYYLKRGAYVAAAQRAKQAVEQYDGAPSTRDALEVLIAAYERLDLKELASQSREVYRLNYDGEPEHRTAARDRPWWKLW